MKREEKIRLELLRKKSFIAERVIDFLQRDPLMLEMAQNDRAFSDMRKSLLRTMPPELRLWATDVVWSE